MADKTKPEITSELLQKIFKRSSRRLRTLAAEGEAELLEVIHRKAAAAQDENKEKLSVTFTHTITVDFIKDTQEDKLSGNIKVGMRLRGGLHEEEQPEFWEEGGE